MRVESGVRSEELLKESSVGVAHAALFEFYFTLREGERTRRCEKAPDIGKLNPNIGRRY